MDDSSTSSSSGDNTNNNINDDAAAAAPPFDPDLSMIEDCTNVAEEVWKEQSSSTDNDLTFTLIEAKKLKKNLDETFEQATMMKEVGTHSKESRPSTVRERIATLEQQQQQQPQHNATNKNKNKKKKPTATTTTTAISNNRNSNTAAAAARTGDSSSSSAETTGGLAVYLRTRPTTSSETTTMMTLQQISDTKIRTTAPESSNAYKVTRTGQSLVKEYEFTRVFDPTTSQETMYQHTVQSVIPGCVHNGESALVFCYGVSNAGKTYTVTGHERDLNSSSNDQQVVVKSSWGLVPRAVNEILQHCRNSSNSDKSLQLSYFEIYNEQILDLLPSSNNTNNAFALFQNHHNHNPKAITVAEVGGVRGLERHTIHTLDEGLQKIAAAQKARRSGTNRINHDSSRSHAVCQLRIVKKKKKQQNQQDQEQGATAEDEPISELWIVDLAGSERSKRTGGNRWQEAAGINKSLMTLNRCLMALKKSNSNVNNNNNKSEMMIPYRDSKLTQLFGHHFTGPHAGRTTMIVNVNPDVADFDETQHVLQYATQAKTVQMPGSVVKVVELSSSSQHQQQPVVEYGWNGRRKITHNNANPNHHHHAAAQRKKRKANNNNITKQQPQPHKRVRANSQDEHHYHHHQPPKLMRAFSYDDNNNNQKTAKMKAPPPPHPPVFATAAATQQQPTTQQQQQQHDDNDNETLKSLRTALEVANANAAIWQSKYNELQEQMEEQEFLVREEVSEEMKEQMEIVRQQYDVIITNLQKQQQQRQLQQTSNHNDDDDDDDENRIEQMERRIQELVEVVEECEGEMKRMREAHLQELQAVTTQYETQLKAVKREKNEMMLQRQITTMTMNNTELVQHKQPSIKHRGLEVNQVQTLLQPQHQQQQEEEQECDEVTREHSLLSLQQQEEPQQQQQQSKEERVVVQNNNNEQKILNEEKCLEPIINASYSKNNKQTENLLLRQRQQQNEKNSIEVPEQGNDTTTEEEGRIETTSTGSETQGHHHHHHHHDVKNNNNNQRLPLGRVTRQLAQQQQLLKQKNNNNNMDLAQKASPSHRRPVLGSISTNHHHNIL